MLNKHIYIHVYYHHRSLPCEKILGNVLKMLHAVLAMMQKAIITTNLERKSSEMVGSCMSRVGLNLISQHIRLRGKTNKYPLFSPFANLYLRTGAISKLNFICRIRFIAQFR